MTASTPPSPSRPPVSPETERRAEDRIRWLAAEADQERKRDRRALLRYELGMVYETWLRDDPSAVREYLAAHNVDPTFRLPLFALLRIFERRRSHKNLGRLYEAAARAAKSKGELAGALLDRAQLLDDHFGQGLDARSTVRHAVEEAPDDTAAALYLEWVARKAGDAQALRHALDTAASTKDPELRASLLVERAALEERDGSAERALELLRQAVELPRARTRPDAAWSAWERLERVARKTGRTDEVMRALEGRALLAMNAALEPEKLAESRFRSVEEAQSESAVLWYESGRLRESAGDLDGAMVCFSHAVTANEGDVLYRLSQMALADVTQQLDVGAAAARHVLGRGVEGPWAAALHGQHARFLLSSGDTDGAVRAIRQALAEDPRSAAAFAVLDALLTREGRTAERLRLLEQIEQAVGADGLHLVHWMAAELAAHHADDFVRAERHFTRALEGTRDRLAIARELAVAALAARRHDAVADAASRLVGAPVPAAERACWGPLLYLTLRHGLGDHGRADALLRNALNRTELRPGEPDGAGATDHTEAGSEWAFGAALVRAANVPEGQSDPALAEQAHARIAAGSRDPREAAAHFSAAAVCALRAKRPDRALTLLREAERLGDFEPLATLLLAGTLEQLGRPGEAAAVLRQAAESTTEGERADHSLLYAAVSLERGGSADALVASLQEFVDRHPDSDGALWLLHRAARRVGGAPASLAALEALHDTEVADDAVGLATLLLAVGRALDDGRGVPLPDNLGRAVFDREVGLEAALLLLSLPRTRVADAQRALAARALVETVTSAPLPYALRIGLRETRTPELLPDRELFLRAAHELGPADPWGALDTIRHEPRASAAAWAELAESETGSTRSELTVTALRQLQWEGASPATLEGMLEGAALADAATDAHVTAAKFEVASAAARPERMAHAADALAGRAPAREAVSWRTVEARALLHAGQTAEALDAARAITDAAPSLLAAWHVRLVAAERLGAMDDVSRALDRLAEGARGRRRAALWVRAGDVRRDHHRDLAAAERRYRDAWVADPSYTVAFERLLEVLAKAQNFDAVLTLIGERLRVSGDARELERLYYEQARLLRRLGRNEASRAALDALELLAPGHVGAAALRIEVLVALERWAEAASQLRAFAALPIPVSQKRVAHEGAAEFLDKKLGDLEGARRELTEALRLARDPGRLHARLGDVAARLGDLPGAEEHLRRAVEALGGAARTEARRALAAVLQRLGEGFAARETLEQALTDDPAHIEALRDWIAIERDPVARSRRARLAEEALLAQLLRGRFEVATVERMVALAELTADRGLQMQATALVRALAGPADEPDAKGPRAVRPSTLAALLEHAAPHELGALLDDVGPAWTELDEPEFARTADGVPPVIEETLSAIARAVSLGSLPVVRGALTDASLKLKPSAKGPVWIVAESLDGPLGLTKRFLAFELAIAHGWNALPLVTREPADAAELILHSVLAAGGRLGDGAPRPSALTERLAQLLPRKAKRVLRRLDGVSRTEVERWLDDVVAAALVAAALGVGSLPSALRAAVRSELSPDALERSPLARRVVELWLSPAARELALAWREP